MKLNLGSGSKKIDGYLSVDFRQLDNVDIVDDIATLSTIEYDSVDEILAEHVIEHFPAHQIKYVVLEWWRRLKVGGRIVVTTPNLLWMVANLYNSYLNIFEPKTEKVKFENQQARKILLNFLYGGQEYIGNYHYNLFDVDGLCNLLSHIGFKNFQVSEPYGQNITVSCEKYVVDMSQFDNIVLSSVATAFGDRLMMYPIERVFKHYFPEKNIFIHISPNEREMYESMGGVHPVYSLDDTLPKTLIIRDSFDVDMKWRPWLYGIEDGPEVWNNIKDQENICHFNYKDLEFNYDDCAGCIAVFIDTYRDKMSIPYDIAGYGREKYVELFKLMPDKKFAVFCGPSEEWQDFDLPNVINVGKINAFQLMHFLTSCNLLISISTSVSTMIASMAGIDRIVLHTLDVEGNALWSGIPDLCVLPPARYKAMWDDIYANVIFLKPKNGSTVDWKFPAYFSQSIEKDRKMYKVRNISSQQIADAIGSITFWRENKIYGKNCEDGLEYNSLCDNCKINTDMKICAYVHEKVEFNVND